MFFEKIIRSKCLAALARKSLSLTYFVLLTHLVCLVPVNGRDVPCHGICGNGVDAPLPNQLVSGVECKVWDKVATSDIAEDGCHAYQAVTGAACGCNAPPKPKCNVCANGYNWDATVEYNDGSSESCESAIYLMSMSTESCETYSEYVSQHCCLNSCNICHGGLFSLDRSIKYDNGDTLSCKDASLSASMLTTYSKECESVQAIAAEFCGCVSQEKKCTLCPGGSPPPLEHGIIPGDINMDCLWAHRSAPFYNAGSENCPLIRAAGVLYCGCDISSIGCSLCGEEERVDDSLRDNEVISNDDTTLLSCAEYESFLNFLAPSSEQCQDAKKTIQSQCCKYSS